MSYESRVLSQTSNVIMSKALDIRPYDFRLKLVGEANAALEATTIHHATTSFGSHALHKAVLFGALAFFGLKCSFRHNENPLGSVISS